jgi:N6-adenosine-specific RNA methylase IME4
MSVDEIARFPIPPMCKASVLVLWRVASMQREALDVCDAWGFEPKSELVWLKRTRHGKRHFGMGRYVRQEHETCIIATRGAASKLAKLRNVRSTFEAPVGRHSEKPEAFFELVERLFDGPYVELYARRRRTGWTCIGDELPPLGERAA